MASRFAGQADKILKVAQVGAVLGIAGWGVSQTVYVVPPGHRALLFSRFGGGLLPEEYGEGMHFLLPWFQRRQLMDVRTTAHSILTDTGTKDLQTVRISIRVLHAPRLGK